MRERIVVVGAGRIGKGIAQAFLWGGHDVALVDLKPRGSSTILDLAVDEIRNGLELLVDAKRTTVAQAAEMLRRLLVRGHQDAPSVLAWADVVIEAVPEIVAVKEAVLGTISRHAPPQALIASATSTIMVDDLAPYVSEPGRLLNAHFLNPAWLIPLVEVSGGSATTAGAMDRIFRLLGDIGKVPVRCAPSPGFIVPRVQMLAGSEAIRLVEEGVADAADVDRALRVGFALRFAILGFLEFSDWGGLDIAQYAGDYLSDKLGDERYRAPPIISKMLQDGAKGMHSGRGFYDYAGRDLAAYQHGVMSRLLDLIDYVGLFPAPHAGQRDAH